MTRIGRPVARHRAAPDPHGADDRRALLISALNIMAGQALAAGLGYGFWLAVSRRADIAATGLASSTLSAVTAAALISSIGIAVSALQEIRPSAVGRAAGVVGPVRVSLISTVAVSLVAGPLLLGLSPAIMRPLSDASPQLKLMVVIGVLASGVGALVDYCAIALRMSGLMVARNAAAAGGRLLLIVVWPGRPGPDAIFFCWLLPAVLSVAVPLVRTPRGILVLVRYKALRVQAAVAARSRLWWGNHVTSVGGAVGPLVLPVIVVDRLGAADAGLFYPTWMLGGVFFMISPAIANAFLARADPSPGELRRSVRFCAQATGALLVLPMLICLALPGPVLGVLGPQYAHSARTLLIVLTLSAVPDAVSNIGIAVLRVRGWFARAAGVNLAITGLTLLLALPLLGRYGIVGGGVAWLGAQFVGAVAVVPLVSRSRAQRLVPAGTIR